MKISYTWLHEYLPITLSLGELSAILTSIGLEVEGIEHFERVKGSLKGLIIGEVLDVQLHPNADKLKITKVNIGTENVLQIVCGAANVTIGQKVIVATVGTTIYPINGDPITMKVAKIRGIESYGMLCAEDEIGISNDHNGIMVLPNDCISGTPAITHFKPYEDDIIEIGLTPNRMDAMSHLGVAKDVCAYLTHHRKKAYQPKYPYSNALHIDNNTLSIKVDIQNNQACKRYSGISLSGINIQPSPQWLANKLLAIGIKPINNVVDVSNYILHETGQPIHIFDADTIHDKTIIVKNAITHTPFKTLDGKERELHVDDLIIYNSIEPVCIAGVFGGQHSGVTENTKNIFIESAWFNPANIRKTSTHQGLRTEAATRFEKGVDISQTVQVLKRAVLMIQEIAGGKITSDVVDIYPQPMIKKEITFSFNYLKKIIGKNYHPEAVKAILMALGFDIVRENIDAITVAAPYSKPDIHLPADIAEEIIRIDGLDNIDIPNRIMLTPAVDEHRKEHLLKEKLITCLIGKGFKEIVTNSITNSHYYDQQILAHSIKLLNNLSIALDVMRPSMLETGLEVIAYNLNRKNENLLLFEFGKIYTKEKERYKEEEHFSIYVTGAVQPLTWQNKIQIADLFWMKGLGDTIIKLLGLEQGSWEKHNHPLLNNAIQYTINGKLVILVGEVMPNKLHTFHIEQPVWVIDINWGLLLLNTTKQPLLYKEVSRFPMVERDLALVLEKSIPYEKIEKTIHQLALNKLQSIKVFDVFEHEKLGKDKRSIGIRFVFQDEEKTLTDKEVEKMMHSITEVLQKNVQAEIRK